MSPLECLIVFVIGAPATAWVARLYDRAHHDDSHILPPGGFPPERPTLVREAITPPDLAA